MLSSSAESSAAPFAISRSMVSFLRARLRHADSENSHHPSPSCSLLRCAYPSCPRDYFSRRPPLPSAALFAPIYCDRTCTQYTRPVTSRKADDFSTFSHSPYPHSYPLLSARLIHTNGRFAQKSCQGVAPIVNELMHLPCVGRPEAKAGMPEAKGQFLG